MTTLAQDTVARADQSGLGTASDGHTYTINGTMTTSISSNEAVITATSGFPSAFLSSTTTADINFLVRIKQPNNNFDGIGPCFRAVDGNNMYFVAAYAGSGGLLFAKLVSGGFTSLATGSFALDETHFFWIRAVMSGNHLQARIWQDGNTEPSTWLIDTTDTTYSSAGRFGISTNAFSTDVVNFDHITVTDNSSGATVTKSLGLRTLIRTQKTVSTGVRTLVRTQKTVSTSLRTLVRTTARVSTPLRTLVRTQQTLSTSLRVVVRGITKSIGIRVPVRTQRIVSSVLRAPIRTQRQQSTPLRTPVRTQRTISMPLRADVRTQRIVSNLLRIPVRTGKTISSPLRAVVSTIHQVSTGLRTRVRTLTTRSSPLRVPISTRRTLSAPLRIVLRGRTQSIGIRCVVMSIVVAPPSNALVLVRSGAALALVRSGEAEALVRSGAALVEVRNP